MSGGNGGDWGVKVGRVTACCPGADRTVEQLMKKKKLQKVFVAFITVWENSVCVT